METNNQGVHIMNTANKGEIWIGLVSVIPRAGNDALLGASGAFTNALALAGGQPDFRSLVCAHLQVLGFDAEEFEDEEPLKIRLEKYVVSPELIKLADEISESEPVRFGSFHAFPTDGQQ
jgi:hypothetical protein